MRGHRMQPWTGKRHIPMCLLILLQTELDPQGVGQVQTELRQLGEQAATFLGMSCSVNPFSCPGFGRREPGLVTEIGISAVGQRLRSPNAVLGSHCSADSVWVTSNTLVSQCHHTGSSWHTQGHWAQGMASPPEWLDCVGRKIWKQSVVETQVCQQHMHWFSRGAFYSLCGSWIISAEHSPSGLEQRDLYTRCINIQMKFSNQSAVRNLALCGLLYNPLQRTIM